MKEILFISLLISFIIQQIVIFRLNKSNHRLSDNLEKSIGYIDELIKDNKTLSSKYKEIIWELSKPIHKRKPSK